MIKNLILLFICCIWAQSVLAEWQLTEQQKRDIASLTNMPPQLREQYTMIVYLHGGSLAYRAGAIK